jgi:hypothetical protein
MWKHQNAQKGKRIVPLPTLDPLGAPGQQHAMRKNSKISTQTIGSFNFSFPARIHQQFA